MTEVKKKQRRRAPPPARRPRLQKGAYAKSVNVSLAPNDLKRLGAWMKLHGFTVRSEAFRYIIKKLLDLPSDPLPAIMGARD